MTTPPRQPPRFIPTLTEVVDPASLKVAAKPPKPDLEAMVSRVQRQVQPIFERRLQEEYERLVRNMINRQWEEVSARLRIEMDMFVRQVVIDALSQPTTPDPAAHQN